MHHHLTIDFAHIAPSAPIEEAVRAGAVRLDRNCPDLIACQATISGPCDGHHLAEPAHIHLCLTVPGRHFDVDRPLIGCRDACAAVHDAFDTAQHRLEDWMKARHPLSGAIGHLGFGGDLGQAYLGTQGDVWDSQKDMALALLGTMIALACGLAGRPGPSRGAPSGHGRAPT